MNNLDQDLKPFDIGRQTQSQEQSNALSRAGVEGIGIGEFKNAADDL